MTRLTNIAVRQVFDDYVPVPDDRIDTKEQVSLDQPEGEA